MEIFQKTEFKKSYKKLHQNQRAVVNEEIKKIIENPNIGVEKVGDLKGIFVHKFNIFNQQYLLAYSFDEKNNDVDNARRPRKFLSKREKYFKIKSLRRCS